MMSEDEKVLEAALTGYRVAARLSGAERTVVWTQFAAVVLAHAVLLAAIAISAPRGALLVRALPLAGMALAGISCLLLKHGFERAGYWMAAARELEVAHLAPAVHTVARGADLPPAKWPAYATLALFAVLDVVLSLLA